MIEDIINYSTSNCVAAFIAEPILGEGGIIVPPDEYFKEVKKILDKYGILFIDDEVQTGFARTGKMFGIEHYKVDPDIVTMAKGIADGFPLGACTAREDIGDAFEAGDHLSTFGGNPVSCAAALANIEYIIKEKLSQQATDKGKYLMKRLNEMKEKHHLIGEIRGKGLIIGVELVKDQKAKTPAAEETVRIRDRCREKGVLLGHGGVKGNVIRIQPPLVIDKHQMDKVLQTLDESFKEVK
jgi:4-aminobutyrate aminotransferase-like enzyme